MTARRARVAAASLALAVVLALVGALVGVTRASAAPGDAGFGASFENLVPGTTRSESSVFRVTRAAVVTVAAVDEDPAPGLVWDVSLCGRGEGECIPVRDGVTGARLSAGDHVLRIAVHATAEVEPAARGAIRGRLVLAAADEAGSAAGAARRGVGTASDGPLAMTGAGTLPLLVAALAAALVGLVLLLGARRRRDDDGGGGATVLAAPPHPAARRGS